MSQRVARSAGLIGLATLASRVLGLVRDQVQAGLFGTGPIADAFQVATRIPTLLRDLFAEGAMSAAFVPTFTRYLTKEGKPAAWRLGSQVVNALLVVTGVLVVLGMVFARPLATAFAESYADVPGKLELTILLTRLNMPFLLLVAVAAAYMGMLNAMRRFFAPSLAPAIYNVVFIACAAGLYPIFSRIGVPPVMCLTTGMLLGGVAQILTQWPLLKKEGYQHSWVLDPSDKGLQEVLILMGPGTLGVAAAQINLFVNTVLATHTDGAVAALGYAFRLMYLPIGIFAVSVATAAIPELARHAARDEVPEMRSTLSWGLRSMLVLSVPATIGLMALAAPIVALIYQRGHFDASSVAMTASGLFFYAPGIIGYSIVKIASPTFYAMRDARTPVLVSVVTILANLVLNIWLNRLMGFPGLALGTAIAANINAGLLLFLLWRRLGGIDGRRVAVTLVKITIAAALMGLAAWAAHRGLAAVVPARVMDSVLASRLVTVGGAIGAALGVLAAASYLLHIEEFRQTIARVLARVKG